MLPFKSIIRSRHLGAPFVDLDQRSYDEASYLNCMWQSISAAPFDRDLELAVIDRDGTHSLVFPCRRILGGWTNAKTKQRIDVISTHWREWTDKS